MVLLTDALLLFGLAMIVIQDFKQRAISWYYIPFTLMLFVYKGITASGNALFFKALLLNGAFIVIQLLLLSIYISIRNKRLVNIADTYLGIGDILFFLVTCAAFSTVNFIVFFITSLLLTLMGFIVYKAVFKTPGKEIPLAGAMALLLVLLLLTSRLLPAVNLYNDDLLLSMIIK